MVRRQSNRSRHYHIRQRALRHAGSIAVCYAALAILWIVCTDHLVNALVTDPSLLLLTEIAKGVLFVLATTLLVYTLVYRRMSLLMQSHDVMRKTHAHLRAIFETSPLAIYTISPQGRVGLWNATAQRMFGWSEAEVAGKTYPAVPEDEWPAFSALQQRVLMGEQLRDYTARRLRKDGRIIDVSISTAPLYSQQGQIIDTMVMVADVTERKRILNIERERDGLRTTTRAMEEVLGVVGHELRTPLASLQAISEVLLTEEIHEAEERDRLVKSIHEETIRLSGMVSNMLEAARLDSGHAKWHWSVVDVGVICRDTAEVIRPLTDPAKVLITTNATPGRYIMNGDEDAIRRLLVNLASNAHKNTRTGTIHLHVRSMYDQHGRWMVLSVTDTGRGISPAAARGLGRAFALNEGMVSQSKASSGAGLGLAICRGIVAAHGGKMAVSSTLGKGTTFTIALRSNLLEAARFTHDPQIIQQVNPIPQPNDVTAMLG
jgi:PAS domain S-box-containing protein